MVAGEAREYHVCEKHLQDLEHLAPAPKSRQPGTPFEKICNDSDLRKVLHDPEVRQELAPHLLPALCLALLHQKPEVRMAAIFRLMRLGSDARSATGALRDAQRDPDERVAKAAQIALEYIESNQAPAWF
jgi:hypothetical protein